MKDYFYVFASLLLFMGLAFLILFGADKLHFGLIMVAVGIWTALLSPIPKGPMSLFMLGAQVAGGHASHRIKDYAIEPQWFEGGVLYGGAPVHVLTPSQGWHIATPRERRILRERHGVKIWVDVPRPPKRRRKAAARA